MSSIRKIFARHEKPFFNNAFQKLKKKQFIKIQFLASLIAFMKYLYLL